MALVRCPACKNKGETPGKYHSGQVRCGRCGHRFSISEASMTNEYNILEEEPPPLLPDAGSERSPLEGELSWWDWLARLARHCQLDPDEVLRRSTSEFAERHGFKEAPPARRTRW